MGPAANRVGAVPSGLLLESPGTRRLELAARSIALTERNRRTTREIMTGGPEFWGDT